MKQAPLKGWIQAFYIPYRGRKVGPYYARCWKEGGKLKKQYIKRKDLERVKAACELNRQIERRRQQTSRELTAILTNMAFLRRALRRSEQSLLTEEDRQHLQRIEKNGMAAHGRPRVRRNFMVPPKKTRWTLPSYQQLSNETEQERWQRWRKESPNRGPVQWYATRIPSWIGQEEAQQAIEEITTAAPPRRWQ